MAQYIAPKTAADNSGSDITVTSAVGVSCYGMHGAEIVGVLLTKNSDGTYTRTKDRIDPSKSPVDVILSGTMKDFTITKPGTYKIEKFETVGTVGIDTEGA